MVSNKALDALHAANALYRTEVEQIDSLAADGVFDEEEVRCPDIHMHMYVHSHTHFWCKKMQTNSC